jgi:ATP-dependent Lon protease
MDTTNEMTGHQIIPLFPLGVVLLPQMELPLHIFEDELESPSDNDATLAGEVIYLLKDLDRISETRRDYNSLAGLDLKRLSFLIPSTEGFTPEERQQFLEITSPRQRLTKCTAVLKTVIQRMKINLKINKIIGGNGDVKKLLSKKETPLMLKKGRQRF